MSGITGLYYSDGRVVDPAIVDRMTAAIDHRGPDGRGVRTRGSAGFGHQLLTATPESFYLDAPVASDPMLLTADVRLDNRGALLRTLDVSGRPERIPDSELLLAAYDRWGQQCTDHLLGAYAFAVWDGGRQRLFAARDHIGVKPFYYYYSDDVFTFGSEIKALLEVPEVSRRLNEIRVGNYLVANFDEVSTFYEGVNRLPPAHAMTVSTSGMEMWEYWSLDPTRSIDLPSDNAYAERFEELFVEAVRCRLRSRHPVGCMLSGGLDSSSIACVAEAHLSDPLDTFSVVFPSVPESDEREYIRSVLESGAFEPHFVRGDDMSPLGDIQQVVRHQDEPFYAPNLYLHRAMYREAKQRGVGIILDGIDGDTTISHGFGHLTDLIRSGNVARFASEVRRLSSNKERSERELIVRYGVEPLTPAPLTHMFKWISGMRNPNENERMAVVDDDFATAVDLPYRIEEFQTETVVAPTTERRRHYEDITSPLVPFALEVADRAAAEFQVEPRYPYFDRRLVEFCLGLPGDQKLRQGATRYIAHESLKDVLPGDVYSRQKKSHLSPGFSHALRSLEADRMKRTVLESLAPSCEYVDEDAMELLYRRFLDSGRSEASPMALWRGVSLLLCLEHLDFI